jgi:hypothetical protein
LEQRSDGLIENNIGKGSHAKRFAAKHRKRKKV